VESSAMSLMSSLVWPVGQRPARKARSVQSAPSLVQVHIGDAIPKAKAPCAQGEEQGEDCFPQNATVRQEGVATPVPIKDLESGSKVLCLDRLTGGFRYIPLVDVSFAHGRSEWTRLLLADGSSMLVTSDHPVRLEPVDQSSCLDFVRASELTPGQDHVLVLKLERMAIEDVTTSLRDEARVALSVHQSQRYSVFVSPPGAESHIQSSIALESTDATVGLSVQTRRSFLHMQNSAVGFEPVRRSSSAPPSLMNQDVSKADVVALSGDSKVDLWSQSGDSCLETSSATLSGTTDQLKIRVGAYLEGSASLNEVMNLRAVGLQSVGSRGHSMGQCVFCVHQNHHQHKKSNAPCWKGVLCERCHEWHHAWRKLPRASRTAYPHEAHLGASSTSSWQAL